jgi:hypothetical protein
MQLSFHLFILLLGFVLGNLFPTFFGDFLGKVGTPVFLFLALDFFNYFYYTSARLTRRPDSVEPMNVSNLDPSDPSLKRRNKVGKTFSKNWNFTSKNPIKMQSSFSTQANSLKIGFLFGLFVDAFKVGS